MASGDTGNVVPGNRLWVRAPCPPLENTSLKVSNVPEDGALFNDARVERQSA